MSNGTIEQRSSARGGPAVGGKEQGIRNKEQGTKRICNL